MPASHWVVFSKSMKTQIFQLWFPLQSASGALLATSSAPNTLKSQLPATRNQQQSGAKLAKAIDIWTNKHSDMFGHWCFAPQLRNFWSMCLVHTAVRIFVDKKRRQLFYQNRSPAMPASHWVFCQNPWKRKSPSCASNLLAGHCCKHHLHRTHQNQNCQQLTISNKAMQN